MDMLGIVACPFPRLGRFAKKEFELHAQKWAAKLAADGVSKKQALVWLNKARTGIPCCFD
jgi:hypothetical protein